MSTNNTNVVKFSAQDRARHTRAYNAADKAATTYRELVGQLAKSLFPEGTTVAEFAKAMEFDISMGKKATIEKSEANRRRSRIADGLKHANLLKVSKRAAQAQRKRREEESTGESAADKAQEAKKTMMAVGKAPTQAEVFKAFNDLLEHASRNTLTRMANELASKLSEQSKAA